MRGRLVAALLLVTALLTGCVRDAQAPKVTSLDTLSRAVTGVGTARAAVLGAVSAVQKGATSLDDTDALCAKGSGTAARASQRTGAQDVTAANAAVRNLPSLVANYRAALTALDRAKSVTTGQPLAALVSVVRDGQLEAAAIAGFAATLKTAWVQYSSLQSLEATWITRSTAGWYRSQQEGADAYSVLVGQGRRFVLVARSQLEEASRAVATPSAVQSATLAAADKALDVLRAPRPTTVPTAVLPQ